MSYPLPEEDWVVPHTPETESEYEHTMSLPSTLVSIKEDDETFEDEEDPVKEEEQCDEEFGGEPANNSPYSDSSSHDDLVERTETHEEDTAE